MNTYCIDKMRFATARRAIDKHRIELHCIRVFGNGKAYRARQFIAIAFYIIGECAVHIKLRIKLLRLFHRSLFAVGISLCAISGLRNRIRRVGLYVLRQVVFFISYNAIREFYSCAKAVIQHASHQFHEVLLQVFVHKCAGHLHENHL